MGDSVVVLGVGLIMAGSVGGSEFEVRLEDLDLAVVFWVNAGLSTLFVLDGEVFDSRE